MADDGNDDRGAIQAAIDHANPGDKVVFNSGTFNLNGQVNLKGGITLSSASGTGDVLLDSYFAPAPGNGWVNGSNFAFRGDDVTGLSIDNLRFKANSGIFNFGTANNATFRWNEFEWGYEGNYYNRHAFYVSRSADGLVIEKNNFHDSENSDRNLEVWNWANGSYSYNTFYKINDGGHIMNPGDNFVMKGNVGRLIHRMGIEIQQDRYEPASWPKNLLIEDNIFSDWRQPFWDSMGLSVPVAGENVTIRNNYLKQNAFQGKWGEADSSGKVRGSYGIEGPQARQGRPGGIIENNIVISERNVMAVSAPGKDTIVRNNKFYGSYAWSVVGGEPGSLGFGSVKENSNRHDQNVNNDTGPIKKGTKKKNGGGEKLPSLPSDDNVEQDDAAPAPEQKPRKPLVESTYLSDLAWAQAANSVGPVERDQSNGDRGANDGGALRLNNRAYDKGLGVAGDSEIVYQLDGQYATFFSDIGIDDSAGHKGRLAFEVWADGKRVFNSGQVKGNDDTESVQVNVAGVRELRLVTSGGNNEQYDHGDWAGARLQK